MTKGTCKRRSYKDMAATLDGDPWTIVWVDQQEMPGLLGQCDRTRNEIRIVKGQTEEFELDTLLHEIDHAQCDWKNEEHVYRHATESARVLMKMGYRRT